MSRPRQAATVPAARRRPARGFTIVELLVVVAVIGVLAGLLLPGIMRARDTSKRTASAANLRSIGQAAVAYSSEWQDRQCTMVDDSMVQYALALQAEGGGSGDGPTDALTGFEQRNDRYPPGIGLGWGPRNGFDNPDTKYWAYLFDLSLEDGIRNKEMLAPYVFEQDVPRANYGWYRMPNVDAFNTYLNDRFYDPVFYAPKDRITLDRAKPAFDAPTPYTPVGVQGDNLISSSLSVRWNPIFSSYSLSPAALFSAKVLRHPNEGGFQSPWSLGAGLRCPTHSSARYPALKTHLLEHHWLQNRRSECNGAPQFAGNEWRGCEPWYFNLAWESAPVTLFYDGHVGSVEVRSAERADGRVQTQSGAGLWSRDTPLGASGYFGDLAYDDALTSFHMLTTDGILGRDIVQE